MVGDCWGDALRRSTSHRLPPELDSGFSQWQSPAVDSLEVLGWGGGWDITCLWGLVGLLLVHIWPQSPGSLVSEPSVWRVVCSGFRALSGADCGLLSVGPVTLGQQACRRLVSCDRIPSSMAETPVCSVSWT